MAAAGGPHKRLPDRLYGPAPMTGHKRAGAHNTTNTTNGDDEAMSAAMNLTPEGRPEPADPLEVAFQAVRDARAARDGAKLHVAARMVQKAIERADADMTREAMRSSRAARAVDAPAREAGPVDLRDAKHRAHVAFMASIAKRAGEEVVRVADLTAEEMGCLLAVAGGGGQGDMPAAEAGRLIERHCWLRQEFREIDHAALHVVERDANRMPTGIKVAPLRPPVPSRPTDPEAGRWWDMWQARARALEDESKEWDRRSHATLVQNAAWAAREVAIAYAAERGIAREQAARELREMGGIE